MNYALKWDRDRMWKGIFEAVQMAKPMLMSWDSNLRHLYLQSDPLWSPVRPAHVHPQVRHLESKEK